MTGLHPLILNADVAWLASRGVMRRKPGGLPIPYLYAYPIDIPAGARTLALPDNERIRILCLTVANEPWVTTPAQPPLTHVGDKPAEYSYESFAVTILGTNYENRQQCHVDYLRGI